MLEGVSDSLLLGVPPNAELNDANGEGVIESALDLDCEAAGLPLSESSEVMLRAPVTVTEETPLSENCALALPGAPLALPLKLCTALLLGGLLGEAVSVVVPEGVGVLVFVPVAEGVPVEEGVGVVELVFVPLPVPEVD